MTSTTDLTTAKTTFGYTTEGLLASMVTPNSVTTADSYDDPDQLTGVTIAKGATSLASLADTRDADGEVTAESATGLSTANQTYIYDSLGQVAANGTSVIGYDSAENLTKTPDGGTQAYDAANEVTSRALSGTTNTYTYNQDGSRITASGVTYSYNQDQQLTGYTSGSTTTVYTYDGDGLRQSKKVGSAATAVFAYDTVGSLPLMLTDGTNNYIYGPTGTPIEQVVVSSGTATYLHADQLGSVRLITNAAGAAAGTANYTVYGNKTSTGTTSPFGFAGQYLDYESGLIWMRARYYGPASGQFLTRDPAESLTRSAYSYARDNPVDGQDPSGLFCLSASCVVNDVAQSSAFVSSVADLGIAATAAVPGLDFISVPVLGGISLVAGGISTGASCAQAIDGYTGWGSCAVGIVTLGTGAGLEHATEDVAKSRSLNLLNDSTGDLSNEGFGLVSAGSTGDLSANDPCASSAKTSSPQAFVPAENLNDPFGSYEP